MVLIGMTKKPTFDELVQEALTAPFEGWDFSWLEGRKTKLTLPWNYVAKVRARMHSIASMLDMGTGGGELLASLTPFPPRNLRYGNPPPECHHRPESTFAFRG